MNLKILLTLCLLATSIICSSTVMVVSASEQMNVSLFTHQASNSYDIDIWNVLDGGDEIGGGWPGPT